LYHVILSPKAAKFLNALDRKRRLKIIGVLKDLADYPFALKRHDVKKIEGRQSTFRVRLGGIRAIFYVDKENERIVILKMDSRESVYDYTG